MKLSLKSSNLASPGESGGSLPDNDATPMTVPYPEGTLLRVMLVNVAKVVQPYGKAVFKLLQTDRR